MMVGRDMSEMFQRERINISNDVALEVKNLSRAGKYQNINFKVYKGEIFGIAGLVGAGRSEIAEALFGYKPADSGEFYIQNLKVEIKTLLMQ